MSVLTNSIYAKQTTDVFGFGVTLNADGSVSAVTGATIRYVTAAPTQSDNAGSLALRNNGTLYVTTGAGTWIAIGGASGALYPDNVQVFWGTTAPNQGQIVYTSASTRWDLVTNNVSQATAQASSGVRLQSGDVVITGAVVGSGSGQLEIRTGATDCTNAGGTGGASGAITVRSGHATSTAGASGATGTASYGSGNSDDSTSGQVTLSSGTGASTGNVFVESGTVTGAGTSGNVTIRTGTVTGAGTSGTLTLQTGTTVGGTRGNIVFVAGVLDTTGQATIFQLIDNTAAALSFDAAGKTGMIVLSTQNGAETVTFGASVLSNLPIGSSAAADATISAGFFIRKTYAAGASTTDFALPARAGGWRIVDTYIRSDGPTGGTVQVQTAGGAANVTNAMVPGNADAITRATAITNANASFASGATVRLNIAAGAPAGEAFIRIEPL